MHKTNYKGLRCGSALSSSNEISCPSAMWKHFYPASCTDCVLYHNVVVRLRSLLVIPPTVGRCTRQILIGLEIEFAFYRTGHFKRRGTVVQLGLLNLGAPERFQRRREHTGQVSSGKLTTPSVWGCRLGWIRVVLHGNNVTPTSTGTYIMR